MPNVDFHTHFVPPHLPAGVRRSEAWPSIERRADGAAAVMVRGQVFRTIDARCWEVAPRLEDMAGDETDIQVLSPMPELLSHWLPAAEADEISKIVNEHAATMISSAPTRFRGIGMVPMQDPSLAAKRLGDVQAMGLLGVEIGTHIDGIPLGDERLDPVYAAAEALDLLIFVHPLHPAGLDRIGGRRDFASISAFPLDTAMATISIVGARVLHRFPRLRVLLSHGGGAAPWIAPRIDFARSVSNYLPETVSQTLKRFWYNSITYDPGALNYLGNCVGTDRLVVGSDYPFAIRQPGPVAFAMQAAPAADFSANAVALAGARNFFKPRIDPVELN